MNINWLILCELFKLFLMMGLEEPYDKYYWWCVIDRRADIRRVIDHCRGFGYLSEDQAMSDLIKCKISLERIYTDLLKNNPYNGCMEDLTEAQRLEKRLYDYLLWQHNLEAYTFEVHEIERSLVRTFGFASKMQSVSFFLCFILVFKKL